MNALINPLSYIIIIFLSTPNFTQTKTDVYFMLNQNTSSQEYKVLYNNQENIDFNKLKRFTFAENDEYDKWKEIRKKEKENNINIGFPTKIKGLTYSIISKEKIVIQKCKLDKFKFITYKWLKTNSWKKIAKKPYDYKDIYFLYKIDKNEYISYKVDLNIIVN